MRPNPAYRAVAELQRDPSFSHPIKHLTDQQHKNYFLVELPAAEQALIHAGQTYRPKGVPHLSFYEQYQTNETQGRSVFHYTWYGTSSTPDVGGDDNDQTDSGLQVVLHVYFNRSGRYLYSHLKNRTTNQGIEGLQPREEIQICRQAYLQTSPIFSTVLNLLLRKCGTPDTQIEAKLLELERISIHIKTQSRKYISTAQHCIGLLNEKDRWTFGQRDPRTSWLSKMVRHLELSSQKKQQSKPKTDPSLFGAKTQTTEKDTESKTEADDAGAAATAPPEAKTSAVISRIPDQLRAIDEEISAMGDRPSHESEAALQKMQCLTTKMKILSSSTDSALVAIELDVFQEANLHRNTMKTLFEKKALDGDLAAVQALTPHIDRINPNFFITLVMSLQIDVCEYIIQHFDECLLYTNSATYRTGNSQTTTRSVPLMYTVFILPNGLALFQMLLRNGADPNFRSIQENAQISLLGMAAITEKLEHARALLEHGAHFKPEALAFVFKEVEDATALKIKKTMSSLTHRARKEHRAGKLETTDKPKSPWVTAIRTQNPELIALFLEFNAPLHEQIQDGFNAIGVATCDASQSPHPATVTLLVNHAAHIDATQESTGMKITALDFAAQQGDLDSIRLFISLGANPNTKTTMLITGSHASATNIAGNPFLRAIIKGRAGIARYLLEQTESPVTFSTFATALGFAFSSWSKEYRISNSFQIALLPEELEELSETEQLLITHSTQTEYESDDIALTVKRAGDLAKIHFRKKEYYLAMSHFFVALSFGTETQRYDACYNIASCARGSRNDEMAKFFYQICIGTPLKPETAAFAKRQIERIERAERVSRGASAARFA